MDKCACKGSFLDKLLQPTLLTILYQKPLHGFSLLKELEQSSIMDYHKNDPTGLYRTLKKMEHAGLLISHLDINDNTQPRRIYAITEDGKDCLKHWKITLTHYRNHLDTLIQSITEVID